MLLKAIVSNDTKLNFGEINLKSKKCTIFVTPNGEGKTTTSNAMFKAISEKRSNDIVSLSDSIEMLPFLYKKREIAALDKMFLSDIFHSDLHGEGFHSILEDIESSNQHEKFNEMAYRPKSLPILNVLYFFKRFDNEFLYKSYSSLYLESLFTSIDITNRDLLLVALELLNMTNFTVTFSYKSIDFTKYTGEMFKFLQFNYISKTLSKQEFKYYVNYTPEERFSQSTIDRYNNSAIKSLVELFQTNNTNKDFISAVVGFKKYLVYFYNFFDIFKNLNKMHMLSNSWKLSLKAKEIEKNATEITSNIEKVMKSFNIPFASDVSVRIEKDQQTQLLTIKVYYDNENITKTFLNLISKGENGRFAFSIFWVFATYMKNCVFILDDPVDSYDDFHKTIFIHELVLKGVDSPFIIFTHDASFAHQLSIRFSKKASVFFAETNLLLPLDFKKINFQSIKTYCASGVMQKNEQKYFNVYVLICRMLAEEMSEQVRVNALNELLYMHDELKGEIPKVIVGLSDNKQHEWVFDDMLENIVNKLSLLISLKKQLSCFLQKNNARDIYDKKLDGVDQGIANIFRQKRALFNDLSHINIFGIYYILMLPKKVILEISESLKTHQSASLVGDETQ